MHRRCFGRLRPLSILIVVLAAASGLASAQAPDTGVLTLTLQDVATPLKPGGVLLVNVTASHDLSEISGQFAGRPVRFWATDNPRHWRALAGVALDSSPGSMELTVQGKTANGQSADARVTLTIAQHRFETRRIRVDPKMANPPEAEVGRIKEDAQKMAEAFAVLTPERLWDGRFDAPVPGTPNSSFGRLTVTNGKPSGRHQGTDFRAATGTPVRAPNAGRIVLAQNLYFAGNTVIIDHGLGVFSLLAHLSQIDVEAGANVGRGDVVGVSGATGRVTGPHLHWAIRFGEMTVDPLALMSALGDDVPDGAVHPSH
jgi:murein DD-endopeptidase MepM/ murein hydrolase activator NlpD